MENDTQDVIWPLTIQQHEHLLLLTEKIEKIFSQSIEKYGTASAPTREGLLALALLGKDTWNRWRRLHPDSEVDFSRTKFDGHIDFSGFEFPTIKNGNSPCANFSETCFLTQAVFDGAIFGEQTNFVGAHFESTASFENATFERCSRFDYSKFKRDADFEKSKFGDDSSFDNVQFKESVCFEGASFGEFANFSRADFMGETNFSAELGATSDASRKAFGYISFSGSNFYGDVHFTGRTFNSPASFCSHQDEEDERIFQKTIFHKIADFHNCKLHQDTSFDGAEFIPALGPEAARAYRTLKLAMEQLKATREEQKFFRLEMKAEHPSLPRGKRWISTLYSVFSDYGFSLWRPVIALLIFSLFLGAAYGLLANRCASDPECNQAAIAANATSADERTSDLLKYTLASVAPVPGLDKMQTELRAPLFGQHGWIAVTAVLLEIFHKTSRW